MLSVNELSSYDYLENVEHTRSEEYLLLYYMEMLQPEEEKSDILRKLNEVEDFLVGAS